MPATENNCTVHNWLESFRLGEIRKIPANCTFLDLQEYAASRFGYCLIRELPSMELIKRICPCCER